MHQDQGRRSRRIGGALVAALLALLTLAGVGQAAPPAVDFTTTPSTVRIGSPAHFEADVAGESSLALAWSFGDGATAEGNPVDHAYAATGTQTVTLTATRDDAEQGSATHDVTVVGLPSVDFTASSSSVVVGDPVSFDASASTDPGGSFSDYAWDFGDGAQGSGVTASHAFSAPGDYVVTLRTTAALDGRQDTKSVAVHVAANAAPQAALTATLVAPTLGQEPLVPLLGQQVQLDARGSRDPDGQITGYAWDLGDGAFVPGDATRVASFALAGPVTVSVRVTDDRGATSVAAVALRVNRAPTADFTFSPDTPRTGATVTFTSTATDPDGAEDLAAVAWDLDGDGAFDDGLGATAEGSFLTAGDYLVSQRVVDRGGAAASVFHTVSVSGSTKAEPADAADGGTPAVVVPAPGEPALALGSGSTTTSGASSGTTRRPRRAKVMTGLRVRIAGSVTGTTTTITSLSIVGPKGAAITIRCSGRGCPAKPLRLRLQRAGSLRVRALQRTYRAGARIVLLATKAGYLPKRVELAFRNGAPPKRTERCLIRGSNGKLRARACPGS